MNQPDLKIILEVRAGSHAYGTSTPDSDEDFRGIAIAPLEYYLGCGNRFEQLESKEPDRVIYDLIKYCRLALDANPNILEMLFTNEEDTLICTPAGKTLQANREIFLSKKVRYSYMGYAFSQIKRIRTHRNWLLHPIEKKPSRSDFGLPEHKTLPLDQQEAFLWLLSRIIKDTLEEAKLSQETLAELRETNFHGCLQSRVPDEIWQQLQQMTGASENFIFAMRQERAYTNALAEYNSYQNWRQTRNQKRAEMEKKFGFDTKFALHTVRLIRQGEEILSGKGLIVKRPDAEELLAIRNGAWTFEQLEEYARDKEKKFDEWYKTSSLPKSPDVNKATQVCQGILCRELYSKVKELQYDVFY